LPARLIHQATWRRETQLLSFFGIPKSRRFPSKHFIRIIIIIIIINIIIINVTSKGYIAISIPSPAPAPSPTLHRVLVEQILSADDFLIFKVGGGIFGCDVAMKTDDFHVIFVEFHGI